MIQQMNLFNTTPEKSGYRLDYMEIYNWGTFDNEIYRISPQGCNSLLTGANASGKSTLIDALLTLLVPLKRQRFYNQSSGAEKKGARTEESYFLGYYGTQQEEGSIGTTTMKLRDKKSRSVLLASFRNADHKVITLFQVRYFSGSELKVVYGIAKTKLEIKTDFAEFDTRGDWHKRLNKYYNSNSVKKVIDFYNGPSEYASQIRLLFNMRSDNALALFNQIVGVKVLDDLDNFIRHHMLDEQAAEAQYIELHNNFQNLMEAKNNIDKTKEQINLLTSIDTAARNLQHVNQEIRQLEHEKEIAAYWFASRIIFLSEEKKSLNETTLRIQKEELNKLQMQLNALKERWARIKSDIDHDEAGRQIAELSGHIKNTTEERNRRKAKSEEYNKLALILGLPSDPLKEDFRQNREKATVENSLLQSALEDLSEKLRREKNTGEGIENLIEENIKRIKELENNKNNISGRVSEIRNEILQHVGATPEEIPFIGELIRIKKSEYEWESSIERILHNFALRLIVPDKYYRKVNEYVNSHNLNGRIVYQHYHDFTSLKEMEGWEKDEKRLLQKIEFKPDHRYTAWIENEIYHRYNYACVDSLSEFDTYSEKAVTKEGLIKSVGNKHEKDDRKETLSRNNYVLGWDNKEKITFLRNEVRLLQDEQKESQEKINTIEKHEKNYKQLKECWGDLLKRFEDYESIDWMSCAQAIRGYEEQRKELMATSNKIQALQEQLKVVNGEIKKSEDKKDNTNIIIHDIEKGQEELTGKIWSNQELIRHAGDVNTSQLEQQHPELLGIPLQQLERERSDFQNKLEQSLKAKDEIKRKLTEQARKLTYALKHPGKELAEKYKDWYSDVSSLPDPENTELIEEYQKFYERLKAEDLISYEKEFNQYLQETIYNNVNSYKIFFDNWERAINKAIEHLNQSLKGIVFNKDQGTYIQLTAIRKPSTEAKDFYDLLRQAIPNLHEIDTTIDGRQHHFETHIKPFMDKLENELWRTRVTDVRSWFTYRAEEFYQTNEKKYKTYESMGQLSGGEKAQLTYTILGSAIAYQFGFTKSGLESSFRFIAIDEAFKAQDEDKARYLLELCNQLHLQLLVVTPSDNIHIVENYISFVHYVERQGNRSVLYNMPIMEYKEEHKKAEHHD